MFIIKYNNVLVTLIIGLLSIQSVISSWDYAVTTQKKILFYNKNWTEVTSAAHQFTKLSAIGFDEISETIYFNDQLHENGSIFSLKLITNPATSSHDIQKNVQKLKNETIQGIAFDPVDQILYWTDSTNKCIYKIAVDDFDIKEPTTLITFEDEIPHGIAIDYCRRKLFWTNKNQSSSSIESLSLTDPDVKAVKIIKENISIPMGITVDQYSQRIYWVDNREGDHYAIESSAFDGTDRKIALEAVHHVPFNLAVDKTSIFWSDLTFMSIWRINKNSGNDESPVQVQTFSMKPQGIIYKTDYLTTMDKNNECKDIIRDIKGKLLVAPTFNAIARSALIKNKIQKEPEMCLNDGQINPKTHKCLCESGYSGEFCEIYICNNYCLEGECIVQTSNGVPQCKCNRGYTGARCEQNLCDGFCLNNGTCYFDYNVNEPVCDCTSKYTGHHCENINNKEKICKNYCDSEIIPEIGWDMIEICGNCHDRNQNKCINDGILDVTTGICDCQPGFSGHLCEVSVCENYCFQGTCNLTSTGFAKCNCAKGFIGERCENYLCNGFCLNDGACNLEGSEPVCNCTSMYFGRHCEFIKTTEEICKEYCSTGNKGKENKDWNMPAICGDCTNNNYNITNVIKKQHYIYETPKNPIYNNAQCKGMTTSALIITSGVIISLIIILIILIVIRKMAKPLRPKVRKTYVVRKNVTPLTCRPGTEQQCEITIEDCCNMNICDTPCFDPNVLQQEARESLKEDKKKLLNNMEHNGDLY